MTKAELSGLPLRLGVKIFIIIIIFFLAGDLVLGISSAVAGLLL